MSFPAREPILRLPEIIASAVKPYASDVLPQLHQWQQQGLRTALVTLVHAVGSTPRPVGSQVAVNERGESVGHLTGGCAEGSIVAEARAAIAQGRNRCVRFGEGSPYVDVKLPCGSGIDVHFDVTLSESDVATLLESRHRRVPGWLIIDRVTHASSRHPDAAAPVENPRTFARPYWPRTRLAILGKGPMVALLAQMAALLELEVVVMSPDAQVLASAEPYATGTHRLVTPERFSHERLFDAWTGVVSLFHDHDWEPPILLKALASPCFFIGALGSRRTQVARLECLRQAGCGEDSLRRIHGPVGLHIGAQTPPEIALSVLAQVIQVLRRGESSLPTVTAWRPDAAEVLDL